jgi:hypothetical protein
MAHILNQEKGEVLLASHILLELGIPFDNLLIKKWE